MTDEGSKQEIINVQDCPNSWCTVKTQDRMERQEHCPQLQNQNDAFLCHFNLTVRVLNMHPCSTVREEDTRYRNEMLPKASRHPLQGSCYEWRSEEHYHSCYLVVWRPYHHCEKTHNNWDGIGKINRTCEDDPTGHSSRREKDRQTEKGMVRQYIRMDTIRVGWSPSKGWGQRRMEKSGWPIILDAPTVIQTMEWVIGWVNV